MTRISICMLTVATASSDASSAAASAAPESSAARFDASAISSSGLSASSTVAVLRCVKRPTPTTTGIVSLAMV